MYIYGVVWMFVEVWCRLYVHALQPHAADAYLRHLIGRRCLLFRATCHCGKNDKRLKRINKVRPWVAVQYWNVISSVWALTSLLVFLNEWRKIYTLYVRAACTVTC